MTNISVAEACARFQIPPRTIYNKLSGHQTNARPDGNQKWQCPITPSTVIHLSKEYMIELGKTISPNSTLRDWFSGVMKRWSHN